MSLAGAGAVLLVYPLVQGRELGWPLWIVAMLVASVPVLGAFARHQARRKRSGATPLVEPSVFRNRSYVSGAGFAMVFLGAMGGLTLALTGLMQIGLGYSAIEASLTSAPYALGGFVGSAIGGMTMAKLGRHVLHAGLAIKAVGVVALYVVLELAGTGVGHLALHGAAADRGHRDGHGLRPAVRHHPGRRRRPRGRLGLRDPPGAPAARHVARRGRPGDAVLRPGRLAGGRAADFVAAAEPTILVTVALLAAAFAIALPAAAPRARARRGLAQFDALGGRRAEAAAAVAWATIESERHQPEKPRTGALGLRSARLERQLQPRASPACRTRATARRARPPRRARAAALASRTRKPSAVTCPEGWPRSSRRSAVGHGGRVAGGVVVDLDASSGRTRTRSAFGTCSRRRP